MASGVGVNDECKVEFNNMKLGHMYRYVIFKLNDKLTEIEVFKKAETSCNYDDFVADLQETVALQQCRYAIYDAEYPSTKGTGNIKNKIFFLFWSPEESTVKQKMVYAASKDKFTRDLGEGICKSSGVGVNPECVKVFNDIKIGHKYRYIVYALSADLKEICVLTTGEPTCNYDDFVECLKESEPLKQCRYGVFDAEYDTKDGSKRTKLVFFLWSPECATVKQKMVYTSSKDAIKRSLVGIGKEVQACDHGDLAWTNVLETLLRTEVA